MASSVNWHEIAWEKLPIELKKIAVKHLRAVCMPTFLDNVEKLATIHGLGNWLPAGWHFSQGMVIRNSLRKTIKDKELPGLPEVYGEDYSGNWDDYYIQALEAAAGIRPIITTNLAAKDHHD